MHQVAEKKKEQIILK